ncbi:MAG: TonB-dependent receptor [Bacteroidota bacterium]
MPRFVFLALVLLFCHSAKAQTITATFDHQPVEAVIQELEDEFGLVFNYTNDILADQYITAACRKLPVEEALELLFAETDIAYELVSGKFVVLQGKEPIVIPTYRLCGRITDDQGEGLAFANLFLPATQGGGSTEADGSFDLYVRGEPQDLVEISYLGYETRQRTVQQLEACPTISLPLAAFSIQAVVIKEYITAGIEQSTDLDHFVLRPDRINVVPGLTEADVLQMTQILPGIQSQDESATRLNIRGGTPDQNLILWDGIPIYNGGHFFGMISSFNPYIVDEVGVYRSGFGPEYGGRVAGVVDIKSVSDIPERFSGDVGINLTHADVALRVPLFKQKSALILSGRRAYSDIIESPTYKRISQRVFQRGKIGEAQNQQEEQDNIDLDLNFVFDDWNVKWLWHPTERDRFAVSWFGVMDQLNFDSDEQGDDEQFRNFDDLNLTSQGFGVSWDRLWSERMRSRLQYAGTSLNVDYMLLFEYLVEDEVEDRISYEQRNDIEDRSLTWTNEWQITAGTQLDFGYQFQDMEVGRNWALNEEDADADRDENSFHSLFLDFNTKRKGPWKSQVGLRWTYSTALQQDFVEPRLSVQYLPNEQWQFRVSAGRYYQFLSQVVEFNDLGLNQQLWILADDDDEPPVALSDHYSVGLFFQPSSFQLEVEAYYKTITGVTSFSPAFLDESLQQDEFYEEGTGSAFGIDVLLRNRWNKYQTWLSYSYGRVFYEFDSFREGDPFPASHDRPHSFTSVHQWEFNRWNLSLSWNLRTGRAHTEAIGVEVTEGDNGEEESMPEYDFTQTNAFRLPVYHRLDASFLYKFPVGSKGANGRIGLSILNVYNRENTLSRQYFSFFDDDDLVDDYVLEPIDRAMLPFTPNMVVRMHW